MLVVMCDAKYYSAILLFISVEFISFGIVLVSLKLVPYILWLSFINHYLFFYGIYLLTMFHTHPSSPYVFWMQSEAQRQWVGKQSREPSFLFLVNVIKHVILVIELFEFRCAGLCLQFILACVYASRCIGAWRLSFYRTRSQDLTIKVVSKL
jgi:hypothetical protein